MSEAGGEFDRACVIHSPRTRPCCPASQRILALPGKVPGGLEVAGGERGVEGVGAQQPPQATPPLPLRASIHHPSWHVAVPPPLAWLFPPASIWGTMTEAEASRRQRAPVMAGGRIGGARGGAFRQAVNTTGVRSSMETAFLSHTRTNC